MFVAVSLQQTRCDRKYSKGISVISPTWARPSAVTLGEGLAVLVGRPGPLEDSGSFDRTAGGAEANVAAVLAQFDVDTAWLSRVGNDGFGRYLVRHLARRGVDVSGVVVDPARPTAIYVKERGGGSGAATDLALGDSRMLWGARPSFFILPKRSSRRASHPTVYRSLYLAMSSRRAWSGKWGEL